MSMMNRVPSGDLNNYKEQKHEMQQSYTPDRLEA